MLDRMYGHMILHVYMLVCVWVCLCVCVRLHVHAMCACISVSVYLLSCAFVLRFVGVCILVYFVYILLWILFIRVFYLL